MNLRKSLLVLCAFALGTSPARAQWGAETTGSARISVYPVVVRAEKPYNVTADGEYFEMPGYYPISGRISLYKNGVYVGGGSGYGSASVSYTGTELTPGRISFSASAYDDYGGSYGAGCYVDVLASNKPQPSVSVDGYGSGSTVTRPYGGTANITVRFKATDPDANLTGIRPNVWRPDGSLDNNGGAYIAQSGGSGEVAWTVSLNQNGTWRFWTEARDASGDEATSATWNSGFAIVVNEAANRAPTISWDNPVSSVYRGQSIVVRAKAEDADGNLGTIFMDLNSTPHRYDGFSAGLTGNGSGAYLDSYPVEAGLPGTTYVYTAKAQDTAGALSSTISHTVTVANRAPVSSHTLSTATPKLGNTIAIVWRGNDVDGNLTQIHGRMVRPNGENVNWFSSGLFSTRSSYTYEQAVSADAIGTWTLWGHADDAITGVHGDTHNGPNFTVVARAKMQLWLEYLAANSDEAGHTSVSTKGNFNSADYDNSPDRGYLGEHKYVTGNTVRLRPVMHLPDGQARALRITVTAPNGTTAHDHNEIISPAAADQWVHFDNVISLAQVGTYTIRVIGTADWTAPNPTEATVTYYVTVLAAPDTTPPTVPAGLTATNKTTSGATLSWSASTDNVAVSGYEVFVNETYVASTAETTYTLTGLNSATQYSITVRAMDTVGNRSAFSTALIVFTNPNNPTGLAATALASNKIRLTWTSPPEPNADIQIYRKLTGSADPFAIIGMAAAGKTTYDDTKTLTASTQYTYKVRAAVMGYFSDFTSEVVVRSLFTDPFGDEDGDGLPNQWELDHGLDPFTPAQADPNHTHTGLIVIETEN